MLSAISPLTTKDVEEYLSCQIPGRRTDDVLAVIRKPPRSHRFIKAPLFGHAETSANFRSGEGVPLQTREVGNILVGPGVGASFLRVSTS